MEEVVLLKCEDYAPERIKRIVDEMFAFFGGAPNFIKPHSKVLLKPNLLAAHSKEEAATTHPALIEALIRKVKECRAEPFIGDSPAFGSAKKVAKKAGIYEVALSNGSEIVEFAPNTKHLEDSDVKLTKSLDEFDTIINVPKLKAHVQMRFTAAVKNTYGFMSGKVKAWRHFTVRNDIEKFADMVLAIYRKVKPAFTIVDSIDVMEGRGPRGGNVRRLDFLIGGINCVAIDRIIAALLGVRVEKVPLLSQAKTLGLAGADLDEIELKGLSMSDAKVRNFILPNNLVDISFSPKTIVKSVIYDLWSKVFA